MKNRKRIFEYILLISVILVCANAACAAGKGASKDAILHFYTAPRVGKTRVVSTAFIPAPFINTEASIALGYGRSSDIVTPLIEIDGNPILGLEGNILYAILGFEYSHAVRDWVAIWVQVKVNARLGNEVQSILAQGVTTATSFELGWVIRLYENERHLLSTGIAVRSATATLLDILNWADGVIAGQDESLVKRSPTLGTIWDMRYVYALNHYAALQAFGQLSYSEAIERALGNEWYYGAGGLVSLDLTGKTRTPIGLALGYRYTTVPEGGDEIADDISSFLIGVSYVGRPDFSIGIDLELQSIPIRGVSDPARFFSALITMDYFF